MNLRMNGQFSDHSEFGLEIMLESNSSFIRRIVFNMRCKRVGQFYVVWEGAENVPSVFRLVRKIVLVFELPDTRSLQGLAL